MTPIISGLTNKFNTKSVKCWSPFDIDSNQILATTGWERIPNERALIRKRLLCNSCFTMMSDVLSFVSCIVFAWV